MAAARGNRKHRRSRGRFAFLFRLLCALALAAAVFFGATVFFQVGEIVVSGNDRYGQEEVIQASGIQIGDNLYHMNKFTIIDKLREELPYLDEVMIRRSLPDTIVITVKEWAAVARVEIPDRSTLTDDEGENGEDPDQTDDLTHQEIAQDPWLISVGGKLLEVASEESDAISVTGITPIAPRAGTMLAVPQEEQFRLQNLILLLQSLEEQGVLDEVDWIDMSAASWLDMGYNGRFDVKIPLGDDIPYHVQVLLKTVETREDYESGSMDLTQEDYAVIYTPGDEVVPGEEPEAPPAEQPQEEPEAPPIKQPQEEPEAPPVEDPLEEPEVPQGEAPQEEPEAPSEESPQEEPEAPPVGDT